LHAVRQRRMGDNPNLHNQAVCAMMLSVNLRLRMLAGLLNDWAKLLCSAAAMSEANPCRRFRFAASWS